MTSAPPVHVFSSTKCIAGKDFGGLREAADADVAATAGREFAEETLGIFAGCSVDAASVQASAQQMTHQIRQNELTREIVHELRQVLADCCMDEQLQG